MTSRDHNAGYIFLDRIMRQRWSRYYTMIFNVETLLLNRESARLCDFITARTIIYCNGNGSEFKLFFYNIEK
ncbi:hypothetical protein D3C81_1810470 [compost metagenome]